MPLFEKRSSYGLFPHGERKVLKKIISGITAVVSHGGSLGRIGIFFA